MSFNVRFGESNQKMNVQFKGLQTVGGGGTGQDGLSAYEIAVKNGFRGTEQEWLASLKGEKGDTGTTGAQGPAGADGKDGKTPEKGVDYFTDADKVEMVNAVIAALPVYGGGGG